MPPATGSVCIMTSAPTCVYHYGSTAMTFAKTQGNEMQYKTEDQFSRKKKKTEDQLPSQCLRDASCFSFGGPRCVASSIAFGICPCIRARPISFEARPTATQELIKTDKQPPSKRKQHSSSKRDFLTKPPEKEKTACLGRHHHHHHSSARRARTRTLACGQASSISIYKCRVHSFRQCPLYRFCFFS